MGSYRYLVNTLVRLGPVTPRIRPVSDNRLPPGCRPVAGSLWESLVVGNKDVPGQPSKTDLRWWSMLHRKTPASSLDGRDSSVDRPPDEDRLKTVGRSVDNRWPIGWRSLTVKNVVAYRWASCRKWWPIRRTWSKVVGNRSGVLGNPSPSGRSPLGEWSLIGGRVVSC